MFQISEKLAKVDRLRDKVSEYYNHIEAILDHKKMQKYKHAFPEKFQKFICFGGHGLLSGNDVKGRHQVDFC